MLLHTVIEFKKTRRDLAHRKRDHRPDRQRRSLRNQRLDFRLGVSVLDPKTSQRFRICTRSGATILIDGQTLVSPRLNPRPAREHFKAQRRSAQCDRPVGGQVPKRITVRRALLDHHGQARRHLGAGVGISRPHPITVGDNLNAVILGQRLLRHQHALTGHHRDTINLLRTV